MAITLTLKGGEKDFELIYDPTVAIPLAARKESYQDEAPPRPVWHTGAGQDGNELVDLTYDDPRWQLMVRVGPAADLSALNRELEALRRTIAQAHAHAMGEPWADEVYIEGQLWASGGKTYNTVKLIEDRSGGYLSGVQIPSISLDNLAIAVTLDRAGYGDEETLNNSIRNGAMLLEGAEGLAQGFALVASPTATLDTDIWLIGGQSQKIVTDAATSPQGLQTPTVTITAGYYVKASVWVSVAEPADDIAVILYDGSGVMIDTAGISDGVASMSGSELELTRLSCGVTWYRLVVYGETVNAHAYVRIVRWGATMATTFYVDGAYLEWSASAVPATRTAWAGYPQVYNRNDGGETIVTNGTMEADDNWAAYGTPETNEQSVTQVHGGTYSRQFAVDAANEGIQSDTFVTATAATYTVGVWVYPDDGTRCRIKIRKGDNSGWVYDAAHTGLTQDAWNLITFAYLETAGGVGAYIVIESDTDSTGDWYVDDVRVVNPLDWVDRVDVWGVPGDMPAWMTLTMETPPETLDRFYLANALAAENTPRLLLDSSIMSGGTLTTYQSANLAAYRVFNADGQLFKWLDPAAYNGVWHVLARMVSGNSADRVRLMTNPGFGYVYGDWVSNSVVSRWQTRYLGLADLRTSGYRRSMTPTQVLYFALDLDITTWVDVDYVLLLPTGAGRLAIGDPVATLNSGDKVHVAGREQVVLGEDVIGTPGVNLLGGVWNLQPGLLNRLLIAPTNVSANNVDGGADESLITFYLDLTLSYRPRTRGWLP